MTNESPIQPAAASSVAKPSQKDTVRDRFSSVAANYARSVVHAQGEELQAMIDLADLSGAERILDAGCGPGHTALTFAPHAAHVVGVDLSDSMLDQGRRMAAERDLTNVEFRVGDVERLPFDNDEFDVIVTRYSAHHWPAPHVALSEFRRVLRHDGARPAYLLLADVVSFEDPATDTHLQTVELLRDPSHVRDHTPGQWLTMLAEEGFNAAVALEWRLRLEFESWIRRMNTPQVSVAVIRTLLADAPAEVQVNMGVEADSSFSLQCALIRAVPAG